MQEKVSTIFRSAVWNGDASLAVLDVSGLTAQIAARHNLPRSAYVALGRVVACAAYLCSWIEEDERLSLIVEGGGSLGKVHVFGNGALRLCGSVACSACGENESVEALIGNSGYLTVTRDGGRGLPFSGTCALVCGNIADDMESYLAVSEQRPTAIALFDRAEKEFSCGGVFLQPLTGAPPETLSRAREALKACKGKSAEEILALFGAENAQKRDIVFGCTCSREKAERAILSAGRECAETIIKQEGSLRVHCHECNTDYIFYGDDIRVLFERSGKL